MNSDFIDEYRETENGIEPWPRCKVPGCKNGCCFSLDSDKCYPHTLGLEPELMRQLHSIVASAEPVKEEVETK